MKFRTGMFLKSLLICVFAVVLLIPGAVASADDISLYPDWLLAGEEPPEGVEFIDGEIVVNGEIIAGEEIAVGGEQGEAELLSQTVSTNIYYITNKQYGKYIYNQTTDVKMKSGLIADIGTEIKWVCTYNANKDAYLIRSNCNSNALLGVPENINSIAVDAEYIVAPSYPDRFYWEITIGANGGCILKNKYNGRYLYTNGTNLYTTTTLGTAGTSTYYSRTWRLAGYMYYGNANGYEKRELLSDFSVDTMPLKEGIFKTPQINPGRSNVLWANPEDFNFSVSSTNVTVNNTTHQITGNSIGIVTVTATHKVTGRVTTFKAIVCEYEATVLNYYDNGYCVYEGKLQVQCAKDISEYTYQVSLKFAEIFSLYLNYGTPQYFESALDKAKGTVTTANIDTLYECSNDTSAWEDISDYAPGNKTVTSIYWTNHKIIYTNEYGVESDNRSFSKGYYVLMLQRQYASREKTLFHELCHQYGVMDHYHEEDATGTNNLCSNYDYGCSECGGIKRSKQCIMYTHPSTLDETPLICEDCKTDLMEHIGDHH